MRHRDRMIVAIAVFRLAKAAGLILVGTGVLKLVHPEAARALARWFADLPIAREHTALEQAVAGITRVPPTRLRELAIATFAYAALFMVEGINLLRGTQWAEWLTIIATASFIPFEIVEVVHTATIVRISFLLINVAIVVYLLVRRLTRR